ncbi:callose synthase 5-like protein, partial [Tanacetum coccineum]
MRSTKEHFEIEENVVENDVVQITFRHLRYELRFVYLAANNRITSSSSENLRCPASLQQIAPILRVATEIESDRPRVAYLCRNYAFEKADRLDQSSNGRGVRQFKTALLQQTSTEIGNVLHQDDAISIDARVKKTDAREIESFYKQYYEKYVEGTRVQGDKADSADKQVEKSEEVPADLDKLKAKQGDICSLTKSAFSIQQESFTELMQFEDHQQKSGELDLLDWLRAMFGFQACKRQCKEPEGASDIATCPSSSKLDDRAIQVVMNNLFKNYKTWCKFLGRKHSLRLPQGQEEGQQRKLLYMGLYLLIWGESANVRFLPECLCYIFHNMAYELHGLLAGNVSIVTGENIKPSYGGDDEAFLRK